VGDGVHLSFRLGLLDGGEQRHGCLVMGLSPAMEAAGLFLGRTDGERQSAIENEELDDEWKEGLLDRHGRSCLQRGMSRCPLRLRAVHRNC
jgi:hypothetical protein